MRSEMACMRFSRIQITMTCGRYYRCSTVMARKARCKCYKGLGSIPASSYTVESEGRLMKQCWLQFIEKKSSCFECYKVFTTNIPRRINYLQIWNFCWKLYWLNLIRTIQFGFPLIRTFEYICIFILIVWKIFN